MSKRIFMMTCLLLLALVTSGCAVYDPYYGYDSYGRYHGYDSRYSDPYYHHRDYDYPYGYRRW